MQRLEVSGALRPLYGSLDVKGLIICYRSYSTALARLEMRVTQIRILLFFPR